MAVLPRTLSGTLALACVAGWTAAARPLTAAVDPKLDEAPTWPAVTPQYAETAPDFAKPHVTEVKMHAGSPAVFLDGRVFPLCWGAVEQAARADKLPRHGGIPANVVSVYCYYNEWHPAEGKYDFAEFDRQAEQYARENPNAYFIWDLYLCPPPGWGKAHPDEMTTDDRGEVDLAVGRTHWSFASEKGLAEIKDMVRHAIGYLEKSPYANRIIGYRLNSGHTTEWLWWEPKEGRENDFSKVTKDGFRRFAAERYPELADATVPSAEERRALDSDGELLWDRTRHLKAIAYWDFVSTCVTHDVLEVCGEAKRVLGELGRTKIVGTYGGYTMFLNSTGHDQRRGHFALRKLLSENGGRIDFLMSPQSYGQRNLGDTCGDMKPFASIAAAGVLPVVEDDTRTFNHAKPLWDGFRQTLTRAQTAGVVRRNMSIALCHRSVPYWYALTRGTELDTAECAADNRLLSLVHAHQLEAGARRNAEVALVASERSVLAMPELRRRVKTGRDVQTYKARGTVWREPEECAIFNGEVFDLVQTKFARAGLPVDYLLAEDLVDRPGDYRLYVFLNQIAADESVRQAVARLQARGATILWLYAPGWMDETGSSVANMEKLTGLAFERLDKPLAAGVTMAEDGRFMGTPDEPVSPLFAPTGACEVLGRYANGKPGLVKAKVGASTTCFSGAWQLDMTFIRDLCRAAGAHVYSTTGDPVEANSHLFTLHARSAGLKTVVLPKRATVVDVFAKRIVTENAAVFTFNAELHSSHLFYFGDRDDAADLLGKLKGEK